MSWDDTALAAVGVVLVILPVVVAGACIAELARRRSRHVADLEKRGSVHRLEIPLYLAALLFAAAVLVVGLGAIPAVVGPDDERAWPGIGVILAAVALLAGAAIVAWPSMRFWIVGEDALVIRRLGKEHEVGYPEIVELRERTTVGGGLEIRTMFQRLHVPRHITAHGHFLSRLRRATPDAKFVPRRRTAVSAPLGGAGVAAADDTASWRVRRVRVRSILWLLAALLTLLLGWPWLVVSSEHYVRDGLALAGVGLVLWSVIAALVGVESLQPRQPAMLELRPGEIAWRSLRGEMQVRRAPELVSASVETTFRRATPRSRHQLVLTFTDGERIAIDQVRARDLGTSTRELLLELHRRYLDPALSHVDNRVVADEWMRVANDAQGAGEPATAVTALQHAIALHPDAARVAAYRVIGDLQRELGRPREAVSSYHAHLAFAPDDGRAWDGLAAAYRDLGRDALAAEAAEAAERLLLRR